MAPQLHPVREERSDGRQINLGGGEADPSAEELELLPRAYVLLERIAGQRMSCHILQPLGTSRRAGPDVLRVVRGSSPSRAGERPACTTPLEGEVLPLTAERAALARRSSAPRRGKGLADPCSRRPPHRRVSQPHCNRSSRPRGTLEERSASSGVVRVCGRPRTTRRRPHRRREGTLSDGRRACLQDLAWASV